MSAHEVSAHEVDFPDARDEAEDLGDLIAIELDNLAKVPDNLGAAFDHALALLGLRFALGSPNQQSLAALRLVCDIGVALFQRARVERNQRVSLSIAGTSYEVPGGNSYYNSAPRWGLAVGAAMTLRDARALEDLCRFEARGFGGSYDAFHDRYAEAVMAFVAGQDCSALLDAATVAAERAEAFPERGLRLGVPLLRVVRAVVQDDAAAYNERLADALTWYRTLYNRPPDKQDASGVVPLRYLGWCALAYDRGLSCTVKSDYLPTWLVEGALPGASGVVAKM